MKSSPYLVRNRFGTLYFRVAIPRKFQRLSDDIPKEVRISMRTHLMRDAAIKARTLWVYFQEAFDQMGTLKTAAEGAEALKQLIAENKAKALLTKAQRKQQRDSALLEEVQKLNPNATLDRNGQVVLADIQDASDRRKETTITISGLIDKFIADRDGSSKWRPKSREETLARLLLFLRITGDLPLSELTHINIREYRETIQKVPANVNKIQRYRGKTIAQIICMDGVEPMELLTLGKNLEKVRTLLKWSCEQRFISEDFTPLLKFKITADYDNKRHPFTASDIEALFLNDEMLGKKANSLNKSYQFWVPILALHTGARINELCQLYVEDVKREGKHWCISINDEKEKALKNRASRRIIPLSKTVIDIGFLKFVEQRKKENAERLFPELRKGRDGVSSVASKWFALYKKRFGITNPKKVFHSFRNTVISHLQEKSFPESKIGAFAGHRSESVTFGVYGGGFSAEALSELANAIDYGVDLSPLKQAATRFHPDIR
jgi:integrase